jgi:hypothetical protein
MSIIGLSLFRDNNVRLLFGRMIGYSIAVISENINPPPLKLRGTGPYILRACQAALFLLCLAIHRNQPTKGVLMARICPVCHIETFPLRDGESELSACLPNVPHLYKMQEWDQEEVELHAQWQIFLNQLIRFTDFFSKTNLSSQGCP